MMIISLIKTDEKNIYKALTNLKTYKRVFHKKKKKKEKQENIEIDDKTLPCEDKNIKAQYVIFV